VHRDELTATEQRVLGCLIEKRWTTPDQYPLSLNGLRLACNQSTNREPVTRYDEQEVRDAAQHLCHYGLARLASGHTSRAIKYRHLAEDALGLDREALAVLAVLLLRGPQTPGEIKGRSDRMARIDTLAEVEHVLAVLGERGYARRLDRRPGHKEDRYMHLLGGEPGAASSSPPTVAAPQDTLIVREPGPRAPHSAPTAREPDPDAPLTAPALPQTASASLEDLERRVGMLERDVASLREQLAPTAGEAEDSGRDPQVSRICDPDDSAGQREPDQIRGAADDHARERHLEAG
jgi:uncharacterized protein YceH (UPF0502 family)